MAVLRGQTPEVVTTGDPIIQPELIDEPCKMFLAQSVGFAGNNSFAFAIPIRHVFNSRCEHGWELMGM
jgi:hypothetical protein